MLFVLSVQHILCCVFLLCLYPMLPDSLDFPFVLPPSVFFNVYLVELVGYVLFFLIYVAKY
jgi:hypothetical protein